MNRTTSLLLALGILVAHALAIHHDDRGRFAPALDEPHVAFRVARDAVRSSRPAFAAEGLALDSYPSPLWTAVTWLPERRWLGDPSGTCQLVGFACALLTCVVISRFSRQRLAGVMAPLLFSFSGTVAEAAASGTELAMLALWTAAAFLAYERRRPRLLAALLALAALTRPEGWMFAGALFALELTGWWRRAGQRSVFAAFAAPAAVAGAIGVARWSATGTWLSPTAAGTLVADGDRAVLGAHYVLDFLRAGGSAWLLLFPLWHLVRGRLAGTPARALLLAVWWMALVAWQGGDGLPFWIALAPALPPLLLAVQEGMTATMDGRSRTAGALTWCAFLLALGLSAVASRKPGDVGSIRTADLHFAWMEPSADVAAAYGPALGREGLRSAIRRAKALRAVGRYLRLELDPDHVVTSPWPGALAYFSRRDVRDLLGRATPGVGGAPRAPWFGRPKVDLVALLEGGPEHVVLDAQWLDRRGRARDAVQEWLEAWDVQGDTPARRRELLRALRRYELVTLDTGTEPEVGAAFTLLRREDLGLAPHLSIELGEGGAFRVLARQTGYDQLADLEVRLVGVGREWSLRPTGEFVEGRVAAARSRLLLHASGWREIELVRGVIPPGIAARELCASLFDPALPEHAELSQIGSEARIALAR